MSLLPDASTITYNGYTLPVERKLLHSSIVPERSGDGRTATGSRYTLAWRFFIHNSGGLGDTLEVIRERLTRPGGELEILNTGFGDIRLNRGSTGDLAWGPWPEIRRWEPYGTVTAALDFAISFFISDCTDSPYGRIMEHAWECGYDLGPDRLERRDITGYFRIPLRKRTVGSTHLQDTADLHYEKVVPPVPHGFERQNESRRLSPDKCRLDFRFTDMQLLTPRPPGVLDYTFEHFHQNIDRSGFVNWYGTMSARYKMALHAPADLAMTYFLDAVNDRTGFIRRFVGADVQWIPVNFSMREIEHERASEFTFSYTTIGRVSAILAASMWRPLPGHDHQRWMTSMQLAHKPRGYTQSVLRPQDDIIIDLCTSAPPKVARPPVAPAAAAALRKLWSIPASLPPPDDSWVEYDLWLGVGVDDNVVVHKPLPERVLEVNPFGSGLSLGQRAAAREFGGNGRGMRPVDLAASGARSAGSDASESVRLQRRALPTVYVYVEGSAVRAGYDIPEPHLDSIGGTTAIRCNRPGQEFFETRALGNFGVPIMLAAWRSRYVLEGIPTQAIGAPATPKVDKVSGRISSAV